MSGERSLISCLPLMKWVLHKPIQTRAMAGATKIIYSESAQWSDTSISSPAGDRENRGGHYKDHIAGKLRAIFYPTLTPPIPQTRPFSPGALPSPAPLKNGSLFSLNKLLRPLVCLWGVLYHVSFSTRSGSQVCAFCVWKRGSEYTSVCNPSCLITGLMCNGFPVILLRWTELHYSATADVYLQMTSAYQLQVSEANLALCWVIPGSPAHFCST